MDSSVTVSAPNAMVSTTTAAQVVPSPAHPVPTTDHTESSSRCPLDQSRTFDGILPLTSLLTQLQRRSLWWESATTVAVLVWDSALGGAVAWLVNYVFAFGNVVAGQSIERQSYATFCAGVMGTTSVLLATSNMATQAMSMVKLHFVNRPNPTPTFLGCMFRLLRQTIVSFSVSLALAVSSAYGLASLPPATHAYKLHFYVSGLFVYVYIVNLDLAHRRIFQLETLEGQQRLSSSSSSSSQRSHFQKVLRLMVKDGLIFVTVYGAAVYIHLSNRVPLESSTALFNFSVASYALKIITQELTKMVMLYQKKTSVKTIYIAVAVPTVLIDTQIRAMILRQSTITQSMAGSVALAVVEIVFRFAKVALLRLEIFVREKRVVRRIVRGSPSPPAGQRNQSLKTRLKSNSVQWWKRGSVDVVSTRTTSTVQDDPQYREFLQWRCRFLRFHAAEIHADMVAEYLAIVCSMSIYYFYHNHPKYAWAAVVSRSDTTTTTTTTSTSAALAGLKEPTAYLAIQIAMEMVVDFLSCVWELVNGVPMHNAKQLRGLISAVFVGSSLTNIVLSAAISIKSSSGTRAGHATGQGKRPDVGRRHARRHYDHRGARVCERHIVETSATVAAAATAATGGGGGTTVVRGAGAQLVAAA